MIGMAMDARLRIGLQFVVVMLRSSVTGFTFAIRLCVTRTSTTSLIVRHKTESNQRLGSIFSKRHILDMTGGAIGIPSGMSTSQRAV
jgi:hypothetical protein